MFYTQFTEFWEWESLWFRCSSSHILPAELTLKALLTAFQIAGLFTTAVYYCTCSQGGKPKIWMQLVGRKQKQQTSKFKGIFIRITNWQNADLFPSRQQEQVLEQEISRSHWSAGSL